VNLTTLDVPAIKINFYRRSYAIFRQVSTAGLLGSIVVSATSITGLAEAAQAVSEPITSQAKDTQVKDSQASASPGDPAVDVKASSNVADWLSKLAHVVASANFQVSFVQSKLGQETIPWLWRHAVLEDGTEMEQLNLQNGPGQEQIRVNDVVSVFEPDVPPYSVRSGAIHGPIPAMLLQQPKKLEDAYKFVAVGRARVSGRTAQQLRIISRDNTRFSYQLWLDETSGMLLKFNTLDLQGNVLEQIQVTSLDITQSPHDYFSKVNQSSLPQSVTGNLSRSDKHKWQVSYLPQGMVEISGNVRRLALTGQAVEHKLFSDGLVDVSIYVQSAKQAIGSDLALRHDLSTFLTFTRGAAQITVLGEIPLQTATAMAKSISLTDKKQ